VRAHGLPASALKEIPRDQVATVYPEDADLIAAFIQSNGNQFIKIAANGKIYDIGEVLAGAAPREFLKSPPPIASIYNHASLELAERATDLGGTLIDAVTTAPALGIGEGGGPAAIFVPPRPRLSEVSEPRPQPAPPQPTLPAPNKEAGPLPELPDGYFYRTVGDTTQIIRTDAARFPKMLLTEERYLASPVDFGPVVGVSVNGNTLAAATGTLVHAELAAARRASADFDLVNRPLADADGNPVIVTRRVNLATGEPVPESGYQEAKPDAVQFKSDVIIDDKPLGRPISKDRQEIIRFIDAYIGSKGKLPTTIGITRYDPATGLPVITELYGPDDFLPGKE
jgi:hypothetical protein